MSSPEFTWNHQVIRWIHVLLQQSLPVIQGFPSSQNNTAAGRQGVSAAKGHVTTEAASPLAVCKSALLPREKKKQVDAIRGWTKTNGRCSLKSQSQTSRKGETDAEDRTFQEAKKKNTWKNKKNETQSNNLKNLISFIQPVKQRPSSLFEEQISDQRGPVCLSVCPSS